MPSSGVEHMVAISRPFAAPVLHSDRPAGHRPPRTGDDVPTLLLVLAPTALLHVLIATTTAGTAAPGEAGAVAGAHLATPGGVAPADVGLVEQLAAVQTALGPAGGASLLQTARGVCLLAGLLTALLLWPVVRRLGLGDNAAAAAVIVAGASPLALLLHSAVDAGVLAGFWLVVAAVIGVRSRPTPVIVAGTAVAVAAAVLTAPLAAAGVLALVAHAFAGGLLAPHERPVRRAATAIVAAATGVLVAVLAVGRTSAIVPGGTALGTSSVVAVVAIGAVVAALAWWRTPMVRPAATMAAVWLACAVWPGPARLTALVLALPVLALLVGALVTEAAADRGPRFSFAAGGAVVIALAAALTAVAGPFAPSTPTSYRPLAQWLETELDPAAGLWATPLDRAELVAAGVPAERFVAAPESGAAGAVRLVRSGTGCGPDRAPVLVLASAGSELSVCPPPSGRAAAVADLPANGPLLVANPSLTLDEPARRALLDGRVDGRLVTVLAGAAATHRLEVADFRAVPGEPADAPRRTAVITAATPLRAAASGSGDTSLQRYLAAQRPPFRPELSRQPDGRLLVHFRIMAG